MIEPNQAYNSANELIKMHGPKAKEVADHMRRHYARRGDNHSAGVWLQIGHGY